MCNEAVGGGAAAMRESDGYRLVLTGLRWVGKLVLRRCRCRDGGPADSCCFCSLDFPGPSALTPLLCSSLSLFSQIEASMSWELDATGRTS